MKRLHTILITLALSLSVCAQAAAAPDASPSPSPSASARSSASPSPSATAKSSASPSPSGKASASPSAKASASPSPSAKPKKSASPSPSAKASETPAPTKDPAVFPEVHAEAALLLDMNTGTVLYSKNEKARMYPASTTKILTAIIALEKGTLSDVVVAPQEAIEPITNEHSQMGIKAGEELTLEQLLYGLLVYSANDAANVIAVHIAGSMDAFVQMMNDKATELGAADSHFANAHGFHDDAHYTTASDLALIARYAMKNEKFREIVATKTYRIPPTNKYDKERMLSNTNHLISKYRVTSLYYSYATGIKTGHTDESGDCLVASATKGDINLLSVLLKCENEDNKSKAYSFTDTTALFDHVFDNYKYHKIAAVGDVVADSKVYEAKKGIRVTLTPQQNIETLLPNDADIEQLSTETTLNEKIAAPIKKGDVLGSVKYTLNGKVLATTNLVAVNDVARDGVLHVINLILKVLLNPFVLIPLLGIILLLIYSNINRRKRRRSRRSRLTYTNQSQSRRRRR